MSQNDDTQLVVDAALGEVVEANAPEGMEMEEWVFTNDKTNPMVRQLFHLLYESAFKNKLGVMHAKLKDKDEVHTLIVGVEYTDEGVITWPIAKILTEEQQSEYLAPDGNGNYQ
jgi:hypothetical protein